MHPHVHMRMCPVWVVRTWSEMHLVVPRVGHMFTPLTHASPATHELSGMASGPEMRIRVAHMSPTHKPHATRREKFEMLKRHRLDFHVSERSERTL
jgi:hypothetical protein